MEPYEIVKCDVLIIGAGGAGLRAAIETSTAGADTVVVCKSLLGKAHTVMAEGGMAAALGNVAPQDSWQVHFTDTIRGGHFINNWKMAEIHAKEAPDRVLELERWGAMFDRTENGLIHQRPFGAHSYPRLAHIGDRTGLELIRTLQEKVIHTNTRIFMEYMATDLLCEDGRVKGVFAYSRHNGDYVLFLTRSVILASGGWGRIYKVTSNSWESTGDGQAMAYRAGAELMDCEMVQFHPTGMVWPPAVRGILVTEAVRGEGGILKNALGERFMEKYDPKRMELAPRDVVARAIQSEVDAGRGSPHGGAYLDITHRGADYIRRRLPSMVEQFEKLAGVDITKEPMEVAPTVHYAMGGVRVEAENAATNILGLFAAGEVAAGLHGANRLGGNSLTDLLVFGRRAGLGALDYLSQHSPAHAEVSEVEVRQIQQRLNKPFNSEGTENPFKLQNELQEIMSTYCGIWRNQKDLEEGLQKVLSLKERIQNIKVPGDKHFNPGWNAAVDLEGMVILGEAVIRSALARKESRGAHTRTDYPNEDPSLNWANFIVWNENGEMKIELREFSSPRDDLAQILQNAPVIAPKQAGG
jgi:succinate dehydrogenase / fumarate reductase flavoprotein subunit